MNPRAGLDWNELWRTAAASHWPDLRNRVQYWDRRAASFAQRRPGGAYVRAVLEHLAPEPHWSVLDVGCGTGTLAIPLAGRVREVTAVDFSAAMLAHLAHDRDRCGIRNLRTVHAGWEDDWARAGIGVHDLAIASRSLVVDDLAAALGKLDRSARRKVLIVAPAGGGPVDRGVLAAIGRPAQPGPDYIYVYNLLHQSGIYAHVRVLDLGEDLSFPSPEEALGFFRGFIERLQPLEEERLAAHLDKHLAPRAGRWVLEDAQPCRWALIWWEKGPGGEDARP